MLLFGFETKNQQLYDIIFVGSGLANVSFDIPMRGHSVQLKF
ncbi:MAG: hypothetical protein FD143_186 [Ignavibacteria bacterium]|nr:MAG: hypothetical protein FD143_186 [Ignavibacteria bacterium]KAF0162400.1 MAG: hypothetical protein FD188_3 [Ignavibacteria bacterium]